MEEAKVKFVKELVKETAEEFVRRAPREEVERVIEYIRINNRDGYHRMVEILKPKSAAKCLCSKCTQAALDCKLGRHVTEEDKP